MRIGICDDDSLFRAKLKKLLLEYFEVNHLQTPEIAVFESGEEVLRDPEDMDIAFLDVELPGLSGIFTGRDLMRKYKRLVIFIITAYYKYLDETMRFQTFRYMTKPLEKDRLYRYMDDALKTHAVLNAKAQIATKTGTYEVYMSDVICVEAKDHKVIVYTVFKEYESIERMQYWISHLQMKYFYQTHRSYIVNMTYVTKFDDTTVYLYENQIVAYLAKRKYEDFRHAYSMYLEGYNDI